MDDERNFKLKIQLANQCKRLLDEDKIEANPHFSRLRKYGQEWVLDFTNGTIDFHIGDSDSMNAMAIYPTKSIVVFRGALNGILRIGKAVVESELFPRLMGKYKPTKKQTSNLSLDTQRRTLLNPSEDFVLDEAQSPWMADTERSNLFIAITELLFGFLVCHEIGHHLNQHGKRGNRDGHQDFDFDEMLGQHTGGSLDTQAREFVADDCGFRILLWKMNKIFSFWPLSKTQYSKFLKNKLFLSRKGLLFECYKIAFIYFYFMEVSGWEKVFPENWTYPPAGFRLQAIYSSTLAQPPLGLRRDELFGMLEQALTSADEIINIAFGLPSDISWLSKMGKYQAHAVKLDERVGMWSCEGEPIWEPFLEEQAL